MVRIVLLVSHIRGFWNKLLNLFHPPMFSSSVSFPAANADVHFNSLSFSASFPNISTQPLHLCFLVYFITRRSVPLNKASSLFESWQNKMSLARLLCVFMRCELLRSGSNWNWLRAAEGREQKNPHWVFGESMFLLSRCGRLRLWGWWGWAHFFLPVLPQLTTPCSKPMYLVALPAIYRKYSVLQTNGGKGCPPMLTVHWIRILFPCIIPFNPTSESALVLLLCSPPRHSRNNLVKRNAENLVLRTTLIPRLSTYTSGWICLVPARLPLYLTLGHALG